MHIQPVKPLSSSAEAGLRVHTQLQTSETSETFDPYRPPPFRADSEKRNRKCQFFAIACVIAQLFAVSQETLIAIIYFNASAFNTFRPCFATFSNYLAHMLRIIGTPLFLLR